MKAQGLARIGNDPEMRYTNSGQNVLELSLAFSYGRKGQDGKRPTQWVKASMWGKRAESLAPYMTKGQQVVVYLDDVHIDTFTGKDGAEKSSLKAMVSDIELVNTGEQRQAAKPTKQAPQAVDISGFDDMDDSIPF